MNLVNPAKQAGIFVFNRIRNFIQSKLYLKTLLVFSFFFILSLWLYMSIQPLASGDDAFFHFRFAQQMSEKGFLNSFQDFKSIYFSKIAEGKYYVYNDFLFYLFIYPLALIKPAYLGIKLYAVLVTTLSFTALYWVSRKLKVPNAFLWSIAIFGFVGPGSLWRFFLGRPYTLAPAILLILLYMLHRKNRWAVFLISFAYLYWHSSTFFFPIIIALSYYVFESLYLKRGDLKNLVISIAGVLSAVAFSYLLIPNFLLFIKDTDISILWQDILGKKVNIPLGVETYPVAIFDYISSNLVLLSIFIVMTIVEAASYLSFRKQGNNNYSNEDLSIMVMRSTAFFISIGFLLGIVVVSGRFGDFFVFFAGLYAVLALNNFYSKIVISGAYLKKGFSAGVVVLIIYLSLTNALSVQNIIAKSGNPAEMFAGVGEWLNANTKPGDIVYNADWSWFSQLYYYSPQDNYIAGINPRFLYAYDQRLYWLYINASYKGYHCDTEECPQQKSDRDKSLASTTAPFARKWFAAQGEEVSKVILNDFKANYIVTDAGFMALNALMRNSSNFKLVYGLDKRYQIYKVLP